MALTPQEIHQLDQEIFEFLYQKYEEAKERGEEFYFEIKPHWGEEKYGELKSEFYWFRRDFHHIDSNTNANIINLYFWGRLSKIATILVIGELVHTRCVVLPLEPYLTMATLHNRRNALIAYLQSTENGWEEKENVGIHKVYPFFQNWQDALSDFIDADKKLIDSFLQSYNEKEEFSDIIDILKQEFEILLVTGEFLLQQNKEIPLENALPLSLCRFKIIKYEDVEDFETLNIAHNTRWVFLTGENAAGKTSILSMLCSTLLYNGDFETFNYKRFCVVEIQEQGKYFQSYRYPINENNSFAEGKKKNGRIIALRLPITNDRPYVKDVVEYLYDRYKSKNRKQHYYNLIEVFKEFLPNLSRIEIDENIEAEEYEKGVLFYEQDELGNELGQVTFEQLAMGYQNILNLVANIILGLSNEKGKTTEFIMPKDLYGIVIIDEFEQHLHPKMQRFLVEKLTTLFPKVQFIVSTHSPIPLLGAPKETAIFHVSRSREKGITMERIDDYVDWENLTPDLMYSSPIFGFSDIIPFAHKKGEKIRTIYSYNDDLETMLKAYAPQAEKDLQGIFDEE